ncbi:type II toxin-antitoxin system HicB family antitoxin [Chryseobacterium sp. SG20098]|uniref:type II toxin-antitoxin system HicB family antitoxin n=1 Tax=Chryseobacterium sp. SG20098 TaxID=3074145 RepID=UPI002882E4C6|nr:type II toxin-antitoxin system HicB family antitoxin [Chryseobacterium sp. SG20098]WNI34682.1 type II toxin-antitoxin system HicB family antitoxin [Chryseobacterium sp. SG20098]
MLEHKDIKGTVEFDQETTMFFGKLIGVNGLVMYEAENAEEFAKNFVTAVEDYIQMCEENEMPIKKEYKGVFNVRTSPENHERLFTISEERGIKLNAVINEAFDFYLAALSKGTDFPVLEMVHAPQTKGYVTVSPGTVMWNAAGPACYATKKDRKRFELMAFPKSYKSTRHVSRVAKENIIKKYPRHGHHEESKK